MSFLFCLFLTPLFAPGLISLSNKLGVVELISFYTNSVNLETRRTCIKPKFMNKETSLKCQELESYASGDSVVSTEVKRAGPPEKTIAITHTGCVLYGQPNG